MDKFKAESDQKQNFIKKMNGTLHHQRDVVQCEA